MWILAAYTAGLAVQAKVELVDLIQRSAAP